MRQRGVVHNAFVGLLVLLAALTATATAVGAWTHQTALVDDRFVAVVTNATSDPQVIDALGTKIADQVVDRFALQQRLSERLPGQLNRLAEPVTQAIHDRIASAVEKLLSSQQFHDVFTVALARLHTGFLNIVNGNSEYFTTTDGKLTLDLLAVVDTIITQLQTDGVLPTAADFPRFSAATDRTDYINRLDTYLQTQLPPDFGQIPIADASSIGTIGNVLHLLNEALIVLAILAVVLVLAAVLLADRRWNAIAWLGATTTVIFGLLIAGLLVVQADASGVVANPDNRVLLGALVHSLAASLTGWLIVIAVAVLMITIPAAFLARQSSRNESSTPSGAPA